MRRLAHRVQTVPAVQIVQTVFKDKSEEKSDII